MRARRRSARVRRARSRCRAAPDTRRRGCSATHGAMVTPAAPPMPASTSVSVTLCADQPRAARAERQADSHLLFARGRSHDEQAGDVDARHQQREAGQREQHAQGRGELGVHARAAVAQRSDEQVAVAMCRAKFGARAVEAGAWLCRRPNISSQLRPGVRQQVASDFALHRQRQPDIGWVSRVGAGEAARGDADDGERVAVQPDVAADDRGIGGKGAAPVAVADDRDGVRARRTIVVCCQRTAALNASAEDGEVAAGDELAVDARRRRRRPRRSAAARNARRRPEGRLRPGSLRRERARYRQALCRTDTSSAGCVRRGCADR